MAKITVKDTGIILGNVVEFNNIKNMILVVLCIKWEVG